MHFQKAFFQNFKRFVSGCYRKFDATFLKNQVQKICRLAKLTDKIKYWNIKKSIHNNKNQIAKAKAKDNM